MTGSSATTPLIIYGITRLPYSPDRLIQITPDEFRLVVTAKAKLVTVIGVEEKFDLLLENYADYELTLLDISFRRSLFRNVRHERFRDEARQVTRRLANFLSAAKLYVDQVGHDLGTVYGPESDVPAGMKRKLSEEYDGRLGYRFMEAARNYMQHRGSIVHLIGFRGVSDAAGNLVKNVAVVAAKLSRLIEDPKFKRAVVEELRQQRKGLVPITPLVRDYVEGLGAVQEALRETIGSDVRDWEQLLGAVFQRGREHFGQSGGAVAIVALSDGKVVESQQLFPELWNYRAALSQKNSLLANLTKRYVSSAHAQPDQFNPPGEKDA